MTKISITTKPSEKWADYHDEINKNNPSDGTFKYLGCKRGLLAKVDIDDYEYLKYYSWSWAPFSWKRYNENNRQATADTGYFVHTQAVNDKTEGIYLHSWIVQQQTSREIHCDHINRDKLDNRRKNLRVVTAEENIRNSERYWDDISENDPKVRASIQRKWRINNVPGYKEKVAERCSKTFMKRYYTDPTFKEKINKNSTLWQQKKRKEDLEWRKKQNEAAKIRNREKYANSPETRARCAEYSRQQRIRKKAEKEAALIAAQNENLPLESPEE